MDPEEAPLLRALALDALTPLGGQDSGTAVLSVVVGIG